MAKKIVELKIEVDSDIEVYFLVNKIVTLGFLEGVKVKEVKYNGKTTIFDSKKKRKDFGKSNTAKN